MIHIFHTLLDSVFPPTKESQLLRHHTPETFLQHYAPRRIDNHLALSPYLNTTIRAAVTECKYQHNPHATTLLAAVLREWIRTQADTSTILLPIPLSARRERERGYNQVEQVCRQATNLSHIALASKLLYRVRDTTPQTTLQRTERLNNMKDAFAVHKTALTELHQYQRIIICDDVLTTGATLDAAQAAIAPHLPPSATLITMAWSH